MQGVGMERYAALRRHPIRVGKIRLVDNKRIAIPASDRVTAIRRRHSFAMRPTVGRDDLITMKGLGQYDHELRRLNDLAYCAHIEHAYVESSEGSRGTTESWVVFVCESLRLGLSRRLVQAGKGDWCWTASPAPTATKRGTAPSTNIGAAPPDARKVGMSI